MNKLQLILVGGGGHCRSCIDVIEQEGRFEIAGIVESPVHPANGTVLNYPVLGTDDSLSDLKEKYDYALVTVGQIKTPEPRMRLYELLNKLKFSLPVIISPTAYVSRHALLAEGTIVMHQALVNSGAKIGVNCIINSKALVEHDAVIEDHCHISTGAIINGSVRIGTGTFFGSNAVSKECVEIGKNIVIGCGVKITKNIPKTF